MDHMTDTQHVQKDIQTRIKTKYKQKHSDYD